MRICVEDMALVEIHMRSADSRGKKSGSKELGSVRCVEDAKRFTDVRLIFHQP